MAKNGWNGQEKLRLLIIFTSIANVRNPFTIWAYPQVRIVSMDCAGINLLMLVNVSNNLRSPAWSIGWVWSFKHIWCVCGPYNFWASIMCQKQKSSKSSKCWLAFLASQILCVCKCGFLNFLMKIVFNQWGLCYQLCPGASALSNFDPYLCLLNLAPYWYSESLIPGFLYVRQ